jgi:hypothetical protein
MNALLVLAGFVVGFVLGKWAARLHARRMARPIFGDCSRLTHEDYERRAGVIIGAKFVYPEARR